MGTNKIKLFRVPDGASHAEIVWDDQNERPKIKWHRKNKPDDAPPGTGADDKKGGKPSTSDHLRSFFTGKGPGAFADDDADDETESVDVEDDDGKEE